MVPSDRVQPSAPPSSAYNSESVPSSSTVQLDRFPDGVLVVDTTGTIRDVNVPLQALLGRTRDDLVGKRLEQIIAEEDILRLLGSEPFLGQDSVRESSIIFAAGDGRPLPLLASFSRTRQEREVLMVVREHGELRTELQDASRWMAVEQERSQELRLARDALEAKNAALSATQSELENAYRKLQEEVATRERLENELRLAQKLEAVGQLAAGLAHEINTPMQYIGDNGSFLSSAIGQLAAFAGVARALIESGGSLETIRQELERAAEENDLDYVLKEAPHAAASLQDGVDQVSKIVRAMKSFARADQVEKSPADLNQAIRDTLVVARGEYKYVLTVDCEFGEVPAVVCLVSALNQAFLNLIVNAVHAVADAGRGESGKLRVITRQCGDSVEIEISDNGCGIPEAIRHRIFDQFFTTKQVGRGTGQGLGIVRRIIVDMHGGSIRFDSEVGKGTTFYLTVPIEPREQSGG